MAVEEKYLFNEPCGLEPYDKEWGIGVSGMCDNPSPYPRVNRLLDYYFNATEFTVDHQRACLLTEAYKEHSDKSQNIKCALAFAHILRNVKIAIYPDEMIVGEIAAPYKSAPIYPEFSYNWIIDEMKNFPWKDREFDIYQVSEESEKRLLDLHDFWKGKTVEELILSMASEDELKGTGVGRGLYLLNLYFYGGVGHTCANYEKLLADGFGALRKRILEKLAAIDPSLPEDLKKRDFYQAQLIALNAAADYMRRYAALARDMAATETDAARIIELLQIANNCEWVAENPPRTFFEALQLVHFATFLILIESNGHSVSYGRFDQYMYPFYKHDLENGTATKEYLEELLECFYVKYGTPIKLRDRLTTISNTGRGFGGESMTVGGVDRQGHDATNDLSFMCLDAHAHTRLGAPWLCVRWHANTPRTFRIKTANLIRMGTGQPKVYNDESAIPVQLAKGIPLEDARDYAVVGCVEIDNPGKEYGWHDSAYFSMGKVLELAINNGRCLGCASYCPRWEICGGVGKRLGPETGSLAEFKNFDEVAESFDKQMKYWCDKMITGINIMDIAHQKLKPLPYLSLLIDDCIEKGVDVSAGGARYNFNGPQGVGVGTVADGLANIKKLVFEEKKVSGKDYLDALEKNWEGYEPLYALVNSDKVPHYGNDNDYADELAQLCFNTYCQYVENRPDARGGKFIPGVYSVSANVGLGLIQWAAADGKKAGEPVSDCLGPVHNASGSHDVSGPTAIVKSVTKLDHVRATNGTLMNWKFTPSTVAGESGRDNLISLLEVFFQNKGHHSQFNIVSRETLEDALVHPEKYRFLLVRVAGYSAYFVELSKPLQMDIVGRTELSFD
ncbi:MAG TPA: formate C-acetyltransferase/glycerol dehydratase family glycyl radical enzyme [Syntrophomonadaceae bacterium]|nr:formate C-acetyltransferase/glycerol dehydratase family glycyl radical enzyme [Syntrophomonadaceae bacterium]HPR94369.1 formate C-acetyltransferase/glycerol dehydratase family glycyl radical enzyme [Syntrophomonadaceae bacterium]